ncbi:hypothetical protein BaRGS_00018833 [Batillaria attramentaria]|uniref:Secreted protein n=1 Tax=Batillaria attramentaria TaxID=370345 RepID=A0ABD0KRS0_9CAEN
MHMVLRVAPAPVWFPTVSEAASCTTVWFSLGCTWQAATALSGFHWALRSRLLPRCLVFTGLYVAGWLKPIVFGFTRDKKYDNNLCFLDLSDCCISFRHCDQDWKERNAKQTERLIWGEKNPSCLREDFQTTCIFRSFRVSRFILIFKTVL